MPVPLERETGLMALQSFAWLPPLAMRDTYKMAVRISLMRIWASGLKGGGGTAVAGGTGGIDTLYVGVEPVVLGAQENIDDVVTGEVTVAVFVDCADLSDTGEVTR